MEKSKLFVLAFSYAKRALEAGSREQRRLQTYGQQLGEYQVIVFTTVRDGFTDSVSLPGITLHPTNTRTKIGALYKAYSIARKIKKTHPEKAWLLVSQDPFESSFVARLVKKNKTEIHHVEFHGDLFGVPTSEQTLLYKLRLLYARLIVKKVDSIRVVSKRVKKSLLQRGVSEENISVLPIFSSVQSFLDVGRVKQYRDEFPVKLLYVGRLSAEKNIPLILKTLETVVKEGNDVTLTIVGDGPERTTLETLVGSLSIEKNVVFAGWQEDLPVWYDEADIFVFASNHEGWGMVLIEAMASGLPILTTDVGCVGEVVIPVEHALVASINDDSQYLASMRRLVSDSMLREQLGRSGFRRIDKNNQSDEEYLKNWVNVLRHAHL